MTTTAAEEGCDVFEQTATRISKVMSDVMAHKREQAHSVGLFGLRSLFAAYPASKRNAEIFVMFCRFVADGSIDEDISDKEAAAVERKHKLVVGIIKTAFQAFRVAAVAKEQPCSMDDFVASLFTTAPPCETIDLCTHSPGKYMRNRSKYCLLFSPSRSPVTRALSAAITSRPADRQLYVLLRPLSRRCVGMVGAAPYTLRSGGDASPISVPSGPGSSDILKSAFDRFNAEYFQHQVKGFTIRWGQGMHSSSGLTQFEGRYIKISRAIHAYLSERELMQTILHEMIHAWLFCRGKPLQFCQYHGGLFLRKMEWINRKGGWNITVDHPEANNTPPLSDRYVWRCLDCGHEVRLRTKRTLPDRWYGQHRPCRALRWERLERASAVRSHEARNGNLPPPFRRSVASPG